MLDLRRFPLWDFERQGGRQIKRMAQIMDHVRGESMDLWAKTPIETYRTELHSHKQAETGAILANFRSILLCKGPIPGDCFLRYVLGQGDGLGALAFGEKLLWWRHCCFPLSCWPDVCKHTSVE
jgi:hypothetical protein